MNERVPRLTTSPELQAMRRAGRLAARTLKRVGERLKPGITTADIDAWVREDTYAHGAKPSQLGYHGFPASVCTSINEVVCHGVPRSDVVLKDGDIINVDITSDLHGWHGDTSATFCIGNVRGEARRLVETTKRAMEAGIREVKPGAKLGDIGAAIFELAKKEGYGVVTDFGGHGIGRQMHLPPHVSHVGRRGDGLTLREGMTFTIEPMLTIGSPEIRTLADEWTIVTADGKWSAQFEHTILVTRKGHEVLTVP
ncbi:MAG: type I methionyl aminopeptidase [Archangium gephyra]|uniref:Methionine aminopeptidase n=1 Tax=Archangium gephyra TaxID=48 RepID=A0A2W5T5W9_9BACT|nr:MAG: type I methionyl aminopeptidase [Archangium gephyra]